MPAATLDDLPAELMHMIVMLLGPDETLRMHSMSRSWRDASESRYSMFFFEALLVFVDVQGLQRLEAISQNERRKCVRKIAFSLWEPVAEPRPEPSEAADEPDCTQSLLYEQQDTPVDWPDSLPKVTTAAAAADAVKRAMAGFENCTAISIEPDITSLWTAPDEDDEFGRVHGFYNQAYLRDDFVLSSPKHWTIQTVLVLHTALTAVGASTNIGEFSISSDHERWGNGVRAGANWALDKSAFSPLNNVQSLYICTVVAYPSDGLRSGLWSLLSLFTSVKTLEIVFLEQEQDFLGMSMSPFLMKGLQSLHINGVYCDPDRFKGLVQDRRARSLRQLALSCFGISGGILIWGEVIMAICRNLELDELRLSACYCDDVDLKCLNGRRRPGNPTADEELLYNNLNSSTMGRVIKEFITDLGE